MSQQLQMLGSRELVVERNQHAAAKKNRVRRDQPLRLVRHDDGGAIVGIEIGVFESAGQRQSNFFEIGVRQAKFFAIALGLDEAHFRGEAVESVAKAAPRHVY